MLCYWLLVATYIFSPAVAYQFMALLEAHAVDTYVPGSPTDLLVVDTANQFALFVAIGIVLFYARTSPC